MRKDKMDINLTNEIYLCKDPTPILNKFGKYVRVCFDKRNNTLLTFVSFLLFEKN